MSLKNLRTFFISIALALLSSACESSLSLNPATIALDPKKARIDYISPEIAAAGDEISIEGLQLSSSIVIKIGDVELTPTSENNRSLKFKLPENLPAGRLNVTINNAGKELDSINLWSKPTSSTSFSDLPPTSICKGVTYTNTDGVQLEGEKECKAVSEGSKSLCKGDLRKDCQTSKDFPAVDADKIAQGPEFLKTLSIAGVSGTIEPCLVDSSNCFLTSYSLMTQPLKAINVDEFLPSLIKQGDTLAGVTGSLVPQPAACSIDGDVACATSSNFPAVDKSFVNSIKASIRDNSSIGGVSGTLSDCSDNASACYLPTFSSTTQARKAVSYDSLNPSQIKQGTQVSDITGTLVTGQTDCSADNQTNCLATAAFPSIDKASANSNKAKFDSSITIAGVAGTLQSCVADGASSCTTTAAFPALNLSSLTANLASVSSSLVLASGSGTLADCGTNGSNCLLPAYASGSQNLKAISFDSITPGILKSGTSIATVNGSVLEAPANCAADGADNCVTVSSYPATNKAVITAAQSKILAPLTFAGVTGTMSDCSSDGADSCRTIAAYPSVNKSTVTSNVSRIHQSISAGGSSGTMNDCGSDGQLTCLAVTNFPAADKVAINSDRAKYSSTLTLAGVVGTMASCGVNGSDCYLPPFVTSSQPLKAIDYDALDASSIRSGTSIAAVNGTAIETPANCAANGAVGCVAVVNYPSMDKALIDTNKAKILSSLSIGDVTGTAGNCSASGTTGCYTVTNFPAVDRANFDSNKAKALTSISYAGVSGTLANCAANGSDCYDPLYNVSSQKFKAIDTTPIIAANIKSGSTIAGVAGSLAPIPATCASDGATACVTDTSYPSMNYATIYAGRAKIRSTVTTGGVLGTLAICAADNATSCFTDSTYISFDKNLLDTGKSKIRSNATLAAVAGTLPDCSANASNCFIPTYVASTQPLKAINYANLAAIDIKSGTTISDIAGSLTQAPGNCTANAQTSCVAVTDFPAVDSAFATSNQAKIHSSLNVGGVVGTMNSCSVDGVAGCLTTATFPATDYSNVNSNKTLVSSSLTIGGVVGTLPSCTADGSSCYIGPYVASTQPLKAIDWSTVTAGIIKNGTTISGVSGQFPNATYPLAADAYADLSSASWNTQVTSAATYGWFKSDGTRQSRATSGNIASGNIKAGVDIFAVVGSFASPNAWDVRYGTAISNNVSGKLKVDCRNSSNIAIYDSLPGMFGTSNSTDETITIPSNDFFNNDKVRVGYSPNNSVGLSDVNDYYVVQKSGNTFKLASSIGGTPVDITGNESDVAIFHYGDGAASSSDTTDAFNNGASTIPSGNPWGTAYRCDGVDTTGTSDNIWKDVTTAGCSSGTQCRFKDQITNLEWTKRVASTHWADAQVTCDALVYDGQSNWRLPTQNELMEAGVHNVKSAVNANWITLSDISGVWWSSTKKKESSTDAFGMDARWGYQTRGFGMSVPNYVFCVRLEGESL
ncbi:MAG: DUF1566 domain-containing protein [Pseudomonas sp.]|nr:MAG: DUF1566 domain-containing protein [Pseudomonas sp.]